jgi:cell division protein FtsZ
MNTINSTTALKELKIKVLGVGGAGGNAVTHLAREPLAGVSFAALNTDAAALAALPIAQRVTLGAQSNRGLGTGGDPERGRATAEEDAAEIRSLCAGADIVILIAGLGGGTGTGASPVIARIARDCKALVLGIALMPFEFEGSRRQNQAAAGLQELRAEADAVICLPNQQLLKLVEAKTPFAEGLARMNGFVADAVRSVWTVISRPGIVPIGFANLCAVTQGRRAESCFAIARATGENRARHAAEQLVSHPLTDNGALLAQSTTVVVSLVAGPGFSMAEVHQVMDRISRVADSAHIVMGATIDDTVGETLTVTLIAARNELVDGAPSRLAPPASNGMAESRAPSRATEAAQTPKVVDLTAPTEKMSAGQTARIRKQRMRQAQLPLEIFSRGRFEKSEPTIHHGQDLDVPTYIRRGVALN